MLIDWRMPQVSINKDKTYCIVSAFAYDIDDFVQTIQSLIDEGWKASGGISASNSMLYQSMTNDEK